MTLLRFTTTRLSSLTAAGRLDELQPATLAPLLERELGADYARLFADFEMESSDVRAWYVDVDQAPVAIDTLPEPQREALRQRVAAMIEAVLALAARLAPQSTQKANLARILTAATTFPIEDIWAVGEQPVIVNWGFHRREVAVGVPRAIRERFPEAKRTPRATTAAAGSVVLVESAPTVVTRPEKRWRRFLPFLLWAAFAILVACNYRTLLPACGLRGPFDPLGTCSSTADAALAAEGARLQALVDQAELDRTRDEALCARPPEQRADETPRPVHRADIVPPPLPPDAPRGDVEVLLFWHNQADLDLIVECPNGDKLWHASPDLAACGGRLMHDTNTTNGTKVDSPVEQAAWTHAPGGRFTIKIELYAYNDVPDGSEIPFTVRIKRGGDVETIEGSVKGAHTIVTATTAEL